MINIKTNRQTNYNNSLGVVPNHNHLGLVLYNNSLGIVLYNSLGVVLCMCIKECVFVGVPPS